MKLGVWWLGCKTDPNVGAYHECTIVDVRKETDTTYMLKVPAFCGAACG